ncbi:MAG TPA: hypothetical protein VFS21_18840 [Roseiflexaceae bacterium]|nr:hypothetical protein [Roseiflexaceae bacterium]
MTRALFRTLVPALMLAFAVACTGTPQASQPTALPAGTTDGATPAGSTGGEGGGTSGETGGSEPTPGADPGLIEDLSGTLENLDSYRMRFSFGFDGKDDQGKEQKGTIEIVQEVVKATNDRRLRYSTEGNLSSGSAGAAGSTTSPSGGAYEILQIGDTSYLYSPEGAGDQKCFSYSGGDQGTSESTELFKPDDIVGGVKDAKLVKRGETVNGVVTDHYTFDQGGLSFGTFSSAKGDAWIASDGGYVVKYTGEATGKNALFGQSTEGNFTWEYVVEDVNTIKEIALPTECEGQKPADDIPIPSSATEKNSFGNIQTFITTDEPATVAEYYKKELPGQGWTAGASNSLGDTETLEFTKEGRKLAITVSKNEQGTNVILMETEGEQ